MSTPSTDMPKGMMARAVWAAENTPDKRNRAVDFYRALAICFVIFGHWFLVAPVMRGGEVELDIILARDPWTQYLTWIFQVMPVFFFVGGFSNALSWSSARKDPEKRRAWASGRLTRLLKPTVPLVIVWSVAAVIAARMGVKPDKIILITQAALVPIWFLAVYIVITMVVPVSYWVWEKIGIWSIVALMLGAIAVDYVAFAHDQGWLRWANYGFVWLAVHQLGYWWRGGGGFGPVSLSLIGLGVLWLYLLIGHLGFPVAMVSVPGEEISNTRPPTTAMLAMGCVQIGVIILLTGVIKSWLQRTRPWAWVILLNQMIMTIYLWHMTAMIAVVGVAVWMGGIGLDVDPGSGAWWQMRPVWFAVFLAVLVPLTLIFLRFESGSKGGIAAAPGPLQAIPGALLTCGGLVMMALKGLGADTALGINWLAIALVMVGVGFATKRLF
ncbi:acyltransferase [Roseovarius faecimaris]|uniref:Acyltransferase n=1 Tax=Roseovarius faecimaris TaxID=2494550 RepID=A0A6I6IM07_9RHOB|nr:acyltransferase [Roseovarius faecimaris]QGX96813.1 acyltransferase [Roseovarius faecimaris]